MKLITTLLFLLSGAAYAQCTKDTDCKGERICEKQICVAPNSTPLSIKASLSVMANTPAPQKDAGDITGKAYEDQLRCASDPEPGKALKALRLKGYIGTKPSSSVDGMNIFTVIKPMTVFGFRVLEVAGWEQGGEASLFGRGPGTAPPLNIQAVVEGSVAIVKTEIQKRVGKNLSLNKASYSDYAKPATEITCFGH